MKLKREVVMLPTNEKAPIAKYNRTLYDTSKGKDYSDFVYQHLYITSNEELKECDWVTGATGSIIQCMHPEMVVHRDIKKIIATTDKSLGLSSPSPEFVQAYIKAYNAGESITDVMVEYEEYAVGNYGMSDGEPDIDIRLKVDKNNCITITKVKNDFTRKDMVEFGKYAFAMAYSTKDTALSFEKLLDNFEQGH